MKTYPNKDEIFEIAKTWKAKDKHRWIIAEMKLIAECKEIDFFYPPPTTPETDISRRRNARKRIRRRRLILFDRARHNKHVRIKPKKPTAADATPPSPPAPTPPSPPAPTPPSSPAPTPPSPPTAPTLADPISRSPEELKDKIYSDLDKKQPVIVISGDFVRQKKEDPRCCCVIIHNNDDVETIGDTANRPLFILRIYNEMKSDKKFDCQYRFIHDNEHSDDNYVLCAFIGQIEKNEEYYLDTNPNHIAEIYGKHKPNIISPNTKHNDSYGKYFANGLKASFDKMGDSQCSIDSYKNLPESNAEPSLEEFNSIEKEINRCIYHANEYLINELGNVDLIKLAANSTCVKMLNELYSKSTLRDSAPRLDTLHYDDKDLYWNSSNVCIDAGTMQPHTEKDTSSTGIFKPHSDLCCKQNCSQSRTTFNFILREAKDGKKRVVLKIPLVDGCCILFCGYLLKHRQENVVIEKNVSNHNCKSNFVNISVYSNGRFTNNMRRTTERVFMATNQGN